MMTDTIKKIEFDREGKLIALKGKGTPKEMRRPLCFGTKEYSETSPICVGHPKKGRIAGKCAFTYACFVELNKSKKRGNNDAY